MPTYTYQCAQCGEFEIHQGMTEPRLATCPDCGGTVTRLIAGGTGFIMKGKGSANTNCGNETPCCGRPTRCDTPPCGK